ncbi:hypothetical protein CAC01_31110 (plasmid) [Streptomyces sp. CLI2509]|nr:hypothetical protein CAC01_31110 [Streptomyces sp. CLI2509]
MCTGARPVAVRPFPRRHRLTVVRAMGTDELHVIGDWRAIFPEGRAVTEVKIKDTYTLGTTTEDETGERDA